MKGLRTLLVGVAAIALGVLEHLKVADLVPDKYDDLALSAVGLLMIGLRLITSTPVGKK